MITVDIKLSEQEIKDALMRAFVAGWYDGGSHKGDAGKRDVAKELYKQLLNKELER